MNEPIMSRLERDGKFVEALEFVLDAKVDPKRTKAVRCPEPAHHANGDESKSAMTCPDACGVKCNASGNFYGLLRLMVLRGKAASEAGAAKAVEERFYPHANSNGHVSAPAAVSSPAQEWPWYPKTALALGMEPCTSKDGRPGLRLQTYGADGLPGRWKRRYRKREDKKYTGEFEGGEEDGPCGLINQPALAGLMGDGRAALLAGETDLIAWTFHAGMEGIDVPGASHSRGESAALDDLAPAFAGLDVVVIYDNDKSGREQGPRRAEELRKVAASVVSVHVPDPHKDVCDYLRAGGTVRELLRLAEAALAGPEDLAGDLAEEGPHEPAAEPPPQWREPVPPDHFGVLPFPLEAFHYKQKMWIEEVGQSAQVAPDMPGTMLLSVLGTALARKFEVKVGGRWSEPLNVWTMVTAETGERKTPILAEAKAPLVAYEVERQVAEKADLIRERAIYKAAEGRLAAATKFLGKNPSDAGAVKAHEDAILALATTPEPRSAFRLLGDDVTPESLVSMMARQDERLALFSSEGGMIKTVMGAQYSARGTANRDVLLKTYSGESITQDRKTSGCASLRRPALSLGLFVQPAVLDELVHDKANSDLGLLARFLIANCPSRIGYRDVALTDPDPLTLMAFRDNVKELLELPVPDKPESIPLAAEALACLNEFRQEVEDRMRPDQDLFHYRDFGAKLPGQVVRIAGVLAISESLATCDGVPREVRREFIERAVLLGRYYLAHAVAAVGNAALDPDVESAKRILAWIARHPGPEVSVRDIFQGLKGPRSKIRRMDQLWRPLRFLVNSGWLAEPEVRGNEAPKAFRCHPRLGNPQDAPDTGEHEGSGTEMVPERNLVPDIDL